MTARLAIGLDLGGTHASAAIISGDGDVHATTRKDISDHSVSAVVEALCDLSMALAETFRVVAIGIAVPGNVNVETGDTRYLPNFGWLSAVPLTRLIGERIGAPAFALNDGRCAALAESRLGRGKDVGVFSMLTLGTGIGGALFLDGALLRGATSDAGDFGHHTIRATDGFDCVCGKRGCFEVQASAMGLVRHFRACGGRAESALEVLEILRSESRDSIAHDAFRAYRADLAQGLANLVTFYNPSVIALGGGLAQADELYDGLSDQVDALTLPATRGAARIIPARLGPDAGMIGAGLMALERIRKTPPSGGL